MRPLAFLFFFLFIQVVLSGQGNGVIPAKAAKLYEKAHAALRDKKPEDAMRLFQEAIQVAPGYFDAWVKLGDLWHDQGSLEKALDCYEKALGLDPGYRPIIWFQAGVTLMELNRYAEAGQKLESYLQQDPKNERQKQRAEGLLKQARFGAAATRNPVPFQPKALSATVNSELPEYLPSLSADGTLLVFTRVVNGQEDFFFSRRTDAAADWQQAEPLADLNTPLNEGAHSLSADGRVLVFTACNYPGGLGSCDLYISFWNRDDWTTPKNFGVPVNSPGYESQPTLSADGNTLIFASTRQGGVGGNDLWQSNRLLDGHWSQPQNLGPVINTSEDDQAPFLHPDGQTLYFMSKGHPGMGGFDLFVARKDRQGQWETPVNLGFPINTPMHEGALVVSIDGRKAFYTKEQEATTPGSRTPRTDIFEFELHPEARPSPATYAKGKIRDAQTLEPLRAQADIVELESGQALVSVQSGEDGVFLVCLPAGKDYALNVHREGYLFFSENFALADTETPLRPYPLEIDLQPVPNAVSASAGPPGKPAEAVILRNVFFESGSADLQPASTAELQRLLELLQKNPGLRIQINGHTDDVGSESDNRILSERRAKAVMDYLIEKGITEERLSYRGYGESQSLAPNDSPQNRQRNRRTEFIAYQ